MPYQTEAPPEQDLPREIIELGRRIAALPEEQYRAMEEIFCEVTECTKRRRRVLSLVQEALSQLRLDIKYLMFDLEVTRRERDQFQERLSEIEQ